MNAAQLQYAGFWKRFGACCIDSIIITIAGMALLIPLIASIGLGAYSMHDVFWGFSLPDGCTLL